MTTPDPTTEAAASPARDEPAETPAASAQRVPALPPDPAAYDSPRAVQARARGLSAPYIAGGRDPDPAAGRAEERHYGRLLVLMVAAIVLGGFVLGFIGLVVGGGTT